MTHGNTKVGRLFLPCTDLANLADIFPGISGIVVGRIVRDNVAYAAHQPRPFVVRFDEASTAIRRLCEATWENRFALISKLVAWEYQLAR
jgi:hypothetical protein